MVTGEACFYKRFIYDRQKFCQERSRDMPKRGENIYRRKDGRWEGRIWNCSGSMKRTYQSVYGKSYREVKDKMYRIRKNDEIRNQNVYTLSKAAELKNLFFAPPPTM